MPSRSTKEQREKDFGPMGEGLLESARGGLMSRRRKIEDALAEAEGRAQRPRKDKKVVVSDE